MDQHLAACSTATPAVTAQRFQVAIDAVAAAGGGIVEAGPGEHRIGGIQLRSQVILRLAAGARLIAAEDPADYLLFPIPSQVFGNGLRCLIGAQGAEGCGIEGPGEIDLRGTTFMDWQTIRTGAHLPPEVLAGLTPEQRELTTITARTRPENGILFHRCQGVRLSGFTLRDSPCFTVTLSQCREVAVRDLRIRNSPRVPNSDGLHLSACHNVTISGCDISGGDDAIAVTALTASGANECASARIVISDCILRAHSAGLRLGYQWARVSEVVVHGLLIHGSNRGILLDAGEGGVVERVSISGVRCTTRIIPGEWWGQGEPLVINGATLGSRIRDVAVRGLDADAEAGCMVVGEEGSVSDVSLSEVRVRLSYGEMRPALGGTIDLQPAPGRSRVVPDAAVAIPWLIASGVTNLRLERIEHRRRSGERREFGTEAHISG